MRQSADWMNITDERILEVLREDGQLTPSAIADRIDKHQKWVNKRCRMLQDYGLVQTIARGLYQITEEGEAYLEGDLDASELQNDEND